MDGIVSENEFEKNYRAKHAKLAKASPTPRFLSNYILASLAFPSTMLRTCFGRDTIFSYRLVFEKNSNMFG
jgi:hypothetical protein